MRPSGTDKALTNFLESLKLLKEISAATNVTFLKGAVGAALHVGQIVQVRTSTKQIALLTVERHGVRKPAPIKGPATSSAIGSTDSCTESTLSSLKGACGLMSPFKHVLQT